MNGWAYAACRSSGSVLAAPIITAHIENNPRALLGFLLPIDYAPVEVAVVDNFNSLSLKRTTWLGSRLAFTVPYGEAQAVALTFCRIFR